MKQHIIIHVSLKELQKIIQKELARVVAPSREEDLLNISKAGALLDMKVTSLYCLVSQQAIPYMKCGKRLYFSKKELLEWIKTNRSKEMQRKKLVTEVNNLLNTQ